MVDNLLIKLSGKGQLSNIEKNAIIYILTEYEKLHLYKGNNVVIEMSQNNWKEYLKWKYDKSGNGKS